MTFPEWMAARQLLAEETGGVNARQAAQSQRAAFNRSTRNLQQMK